MPVLFGSNEPKPLIMSSRAAPEKGPEGGQKRMSLMSFEALAGGIVGTPDQGWERRVVLTPIASSLRMYELTIRTT